MQSSTVRNAYMEQDAFKAVDGDRNSDYKEGSCSHTASRPSTSESPWWAVDLGAVKHVKKVVIVNRVDCCGKTKAKIGNIKVS